MTPLEFAVDRPNLAVVLARLGSELADWAACSRHIENAVLPRLTGGGGADVQQFDALTQHLEQMSGFLLRLSAAADDGAGLTTDDIGRLAATISLSRLADRLTGREPASEGTKPGEVELW
ncbi:MAG: hypothetical protein KKC29_02090 [Alphaproteobacteria bacterium]|jgi:hypothetical protein|nr:hypothetical protein [Alphaproteobacteria bacterium]MBU2040646.1 hypothetical protein [Alphaproteobacteria bacterium]MBU2125671.1 hypothetical protein [Alphaproteobacteria bacterium]MBU2209078.1 hypothetical protein [Alphaproteobacteria bacterium]MBU2289877.1 hypothetical protein [Alphaproteobacteria bacterium]